MSSTDTVLLRPRPYARYAGVLLLVPLLPQQKALKPLPAEIWADIFAYVLASGRNDGVSSWWFAEVCKTFHEIALPLLYASVRFRQITSLEKFFKHLHIADQKWDSIRRIPYSTPGRWVHSLDLSTLVFQGQSMALHLDTLLTRLFPLIPFLHTLSINPAFVLSRRALSSLAHREGAIHLRCLEGLSYVPPLSSSSSIAEEEEEEDPFVLLLRRCPHIEHLIIIGQGLDPTEFVEFNFTGLAFTSVSLNLPKLRLLSLLSMHSSPLMQALLNSPLPALEKLEITPYDDIPYPASLSTHFIATHGHSLRSLLLFTPKSWPTRLRPSPDTLLAYCPSLHHLSCEAPLPNLTLSHSHHRLRMLSIPRPTTEFWRVLVDNHVLAMLPNLVVLRIRDVRWMRKGVSSLAQEAGVQGLMKEWKRRLERRGIQLLDADWK